MARATWIISYIDPVTRKTIGYHKSETASCKKRCDAKTYQTEYDAYHAAADIREAGQSCVVLIND